MRVHYMYIIQYTCQAILWKGQEIKLNIAQTVALVLLRYKKVETLKSILKSACISEVPGDLNFADDWNCW